MSKPLRRREAIMDILRNVSVVTVAELSEKLMVTMETIRKDLGALEEEGLVVRIHGGVALADKSDGNVPYELREHIGWAEKERIADKACELVEPGTSILLESGTTMAAFCHALVQRPDVLKTLIIITSSFYIAQTLEYGRLCRSLVFLGGWCNADENATYGAARVKMLEDLHVDKAFISGAALSRDLILTAYFEDDMQFQQQAIASATETILLINSGKYQTSGVLTVGDISQIQYMVTDIPFAPDVLEQIKSKGTGVLLA